MTWFEKVLKRLPDSAAVHNNIGKAYELKGNQRQARESFRRACLLDPNLAEVWFNLAELDQRSGFLEQAVAHYQQAIRINPLMNAAHNNMGNALRDLKRYPEAIEAFRKLVALAPDLAQGHYNLGSVYRMTGQYPEAMIHLSKAIELQPAYVDAWNNLALACKNVGDLDRALNYFNKAVQLQPDFAIAYWNRSFVHFLNGNWSQGWCDFEWRFQVPHWPTIYPHRISAKRWNGQPIGSQTLLVHDEQGLGDTFQFARFLPWAKARCGCLILETRQELVPLLENTLGIDDIIIRSSEGPPTIPFDQYSPLMSLGHIQNVDPNRMPPMQPYIKAPQNKIAKWRPRMPSSGINIGLVWAGRPEHANDTNRSCNLKLFEPLFRMPEFHFIGLQKGPATAQAKEASGCKTFSNWGDELESFSDTAGVIHHLDLVLTVDTSVAHLAGAMGRPVWVLIPFLPDWRWGMKGTLTPWYPSMRLFRQTRCGDWQTVIGLVQSELEHIYKLRTDPHKSRMAMAY
jgi:Tfp pilus assembly protein PilF